MHSPSSLQTSSDPFLFLQTLFIGFVACRCARIWLCRRDGDQWSIEYWFGGSEFDWSAELAKQRGRRFTGASAPINEAGHTNSNRRGAQIQGAPSWSEREGRSKGCTQLDAWSKAIRRRKRNCRASFVLCPCSRSSNGHPTSALCYSTFRARKSTP